MGTNNVYYRFLHLTSNHNYQGMPARTALTRRTSNCGARRFRSSKAARPVDSHEKVVRDKGMSEESVLAAIRLAAVIHGLAAVLDAERVAATQAVGAWLLFFLRKQGGKNISRLSLFRIKVGRRQPPQAPASDR